MILAATGHRPPKLGGYSPQVFERLRAFARDRLTQMAPTSVISGMALGWDTAIAYAALDLSIPFDAYIPCEGQDSVWPLESRNTFAFLRARARHVRIICPSYSAQAMQLRNRAMVDDCTDLLALYDGSRGGTANCIDYARTRPTIVIHNCWARWTTWPL